MKDILYLGTGAMLVIIFILTAVLSSPFLLLLVCYETKHAPETEKSAPDPDQDNRWAQDYAGMAEYN